MAFLTETGVARLWSHVVSKLNNKVDKVDGHRLITTSEASKLEALVLGDTGQVEISGKVNSDNVEGLDEKLALKVDKVIGMGLSTNDYTTAEKNKLSGIADGANKTVVDSALSDSSTNPVQNKVVNDAIKNLNTLVGDTAVSEQISTAIVDACVLTIDTTDAEEGTANLINADTVGGLAADSFVLETEFDAYKNTVIAVNKGGTGATTAANARTNLGVNTQAEILSAAYPVGSVYISVNSTSPASLFGGTWEQLKDRFLLGAGDTYSNGATGGAATVKLTIDQIPSHSHTVYSRSVYSSGGSYIALCNEANSTNSYVTGGKGGSEAHNNMPPYLTVYMWKRVS